jgi:hypothetical protein
MDRHPDLFAIATISLINRPRDRGRVLNHQFDRIFSLRRAHEATEPHRNVIECVHRKHIGDILMGPR